MYVFAGETGNFSELMAEQIRMYFNDSDERIQFFVESVWTDSGANSPVFILGAIASISALMYLWAMFNLSPPPSEWMYTPSVFNS